MKHTAVQYWETFPLQNGGWRKLVIETALEEGDTPRDAFYAGQKEVRNFHYESKGAEEKQVKQEPESIGTAGDIIAKINKCTTLPKPLGLLSYELIAKTSPELQVAFDKKFAELSMNK